MRNLLDPEIDQFRDRGQEVIDHYGWVGDHENGTFFYPVAGVVLRIIASVGQGWDHLSISAPYRTPTWTEMEVVKRKFFKPDEVCMQLHVAEADHIDLHPHVLHIWRPHKQKIPLPPKDMV